MGQGIYTAIVYGAIDPPTDLTDADGYTDAAPWYVDAAEAAEAEHGVHFGNSYEAEPFCRGVTVAVSDRWLAERWIVPVFARCVLPADGLADWVREHAAEGMRRAQAAWESVRAAGRVAGVDVPEGRLLLVCDWD